MDEKISKYAKKEFNKVSLVLAGLTEAMCYPSH